MATNQVRIKTSCKKKKKKREEEEEKRKEEKRFYFFKYSVSPYSHSSSRIVISSGYLNRSDND